MSQAIFHAPRRKRKVYESYESPFPLPLSHDSYAKDFRICQAEIINNFIIVRNLEDILLLYGKSIPKSEARNSPIHRGMLVTAQEEKQRHVEWARSLLEGQGMDRSSADRILEDYCSPLDLPEDKDETVDSVDLKSQEELNTADERNEVLEGNPLFDPLSKYSSQELEAEEPYIVPDKEVLEKMHCHRHDDLIVHCGCRPAKRTVQDYASEKSVIDGQQHAYVLVEEEQDTAGLKDEDVQEYKNETHKLVCRRNPFQMFEYLQLSREEEPLTIQKLWEIFCEAQQNFQTGYMAYHHFRSKGWVPKVGLKYGTDLLLYRKGPPFYHAR
ncbi:hypothetical protein AB205_0047590, partial [Aquarana catesbeiana]